MVPIRSLTALALILGLAACNLASTRPAYVYDAYHLGVLSGPAAQGGMAAFLVGEPFPGEEPALRRAVEYALTEQRFGPVFPVTTEPSPALRDSPYKVVLVFDPAGGWDGYAACKHGELPRSVGRRGESLEVLALFCEGHRLMTSTQGRVVAASPADPRFQALMKQIALDLFPPLRWNRDADDALEARAQ
ncbi:MAG: hypothetical protein WD100_07520 [Tistlia sp.]|uniref:hypothetical protein n=1 Tax=Tistlia sp. TaxID=3057121 RepID=UPI0034A3760E